MDDLLNDFAAWLSDILLWVPRKLWSELLDGLAALVEAIPAPDFIATAQNAFNSIPPSVLFFADKFQLSAGVSMIMGAYVLRFIIRRIPVIG